MIKINWEETVIVKVNLIIDILEVTNRPVFSLNSELCLDAIAINSSTVIHLEWPFPAELVARQCLPTQYGLSRLCLSLAGVAVLLYHCSLRFQLADH